MILTFGSAYLLGWLLTPPLADIFLLTQKRRSKDFADKMDRMFIGVRINKVILVYTFLPFFSGVAGYLLFPSEMKLLGVAVCVFLGFLGPNVFMKVLTERRKSKFEDQLVDALMILSSSLKGGLSLIQTLEVVVEEMPDPIKQEFGILLGENKMGVSLEESFTHLYERLPSTPLHQMITAILLARETGGNLPAIFSRIIGTIRENKKIKQNLDNLTLQGKIQGVVMALLPVAFAAVVTSTNPRFFDQMFTSEIGRMLLMYAVVSEIIGAFMIWKISSFKDF